MKYEILIYPDPGLRVTAQQVTSFDDNLKQTCHDLLETMYHTQGIGLAATQVGVNQRVFVMDTSESQTEPKFFINPVIVQREGTETATEGCLSFPGLYIDVTRTEAVTVKAQDETGTEITLSADGLLARCIQHELDHLDGKVFIDHLSRLKRERAVKRLKKLLSQQGN